MQKLHSIFLNIIIAMGLVCLFSSCDFVEDEIKQEKRLAYYRHTTYSVQDSLSTNSARIKAYKNIVKQISEDKYLITSRKKNKLLSEVHTTMGGEYFVSGAVDKGIASNTLAITLDTANQSAYYNRACIYQHIGNDSLAIADYGKALQYDKKYVDAYYNRGIIHQKYGNHQMAIDDYTQAIELSPTYLIDVYNNRGNAYQEIDLFKKAVADYSSAIALDTTNIALYCNRADAYFQLNETEKGEKDYKKVMQIDPANRLVQKKIELSKKRVKKDKSK